MYPENPKETRVIIGCMNMGYASDAARTPRTRTPNLFVPTPKCRIIKWIIMCDESNMLKNWFAGLDNIQKDKKLKHKLNIM